MVFQAHGSRWIKRLWWIGEVVMEGEEQMEKCPFCQGASGVTKGNEWTQVAPGEIAH